MRKQLILAAALVGVVAAGAGAYSANVQAKAETDWSAFTISSTAVRTEDPSGLRFKVNCPVNVVESATTTLTFTSSVLGTEEEYSTTIPVDVWRPDGSGWNAVLLDIPASDYATEVTAKAAVTVGGQTYETAEVTTSIAKTAAKVMAQGETSALVSKYVSGVVTAVNLDDTATVEDGKTLQLNATTSPAGYAIKWTSENKDVVTVDANGLVTAVGVGTTNVTASVGNVSKSCEVTVSYRDTYDFEDGYAPAFLHADASWSTNGGSEVADGAFKSWGDYTYEAFNIDKAFMDWAFADKYKAITFDLTVGFEGERTYLALQVQGANIPNYYFGNGEKQTITITKKMYDAWLAYDDMEFLRFLAQNQAGGAVTYTIDNLKVVDSTVIENFDQFASAYAYDQISDTTATGYIDYIGFFYTGSGGNAATGLVSYSHPVKKSEQSKYIVSESGADIANIDDDGAFMLRANNYRLTYYFSMEFLDDVFADENVKALAWNLKHYTACDGTEQMPIKRYAVIDEKPIDPSTNEVLDSTHAGKSLTQLEDVEYYDYNVWSECTLTRAEYQALKDAGSTALVFRVLSDKASSLNTITRVLLNNFRYVF